MRKYILINAILILITISFSHSQQQSTTITLDQAIAIALERNIGIIQAENTLEGQESNRLAAYGDLLPSLSARGGWSRDLIDKVATTQTIGGTTIPSPAQFSVTNSFSSSVSLSYTIFNGFANTASLNQAQAGVGAAENALHRTQQQTVYETTQLYLNVLRTRELLKVREENVKRSKKQLERIQESNRVGALSLADVYRQQVQVGSDELALIQAQSDYDNAKTDLAFYLALNVMEAYDFSDPAVTSDVDKTESKAVDERYANFNELVKQALVVRPDYLSALETYNGASSGVAVARAGHFPSVTAGASYGYGANEFSGLSDNRSMSWGLQITLPIFSGFQVDNLVDQARVNERNAFEQLKQAERKVQVDIRKALLDYESAKKQIDVTQRSVVSAGQDRRIAEEKYNLGAGTLLDLLIANANYVSAVSNNVNAVYSYKLVKKQLEFATGTLTY